MAKVSRNYLARSAVKQVRLRHSPLGKREEGGIFESERLQGESGPAVEWIAVSHFRSESAVQGGKSILALRTGRAGQR